MTEVESREFVKGNISQEAVILQLAEEAAELSAAASKLLRVLNGENPSPVFPEDARENMLEEFGDVLDCMDLLITPTESSAVTERRMKKFVRWVQRIKAKRVADHANMEAGVTNEADEERRQAG